MQPWFPQAKLGIFIHYGIYAVDGVAESWSFYNGSVPHDQYMAQLNGFTAAAYDPRQWAELFAKAEARYAVLTTRHHDGVALWESGLHVGQDLVTPYVQAMRERGLKVGFYYSHSDWNHPDYASVRSQGKATWVNDSPYVAPPEGAEDPDRWERYLDYRDGQVGELVSRHRPDLLWFDGEWERAEEQWRMKPLAEIILRANPETILNARMGCYGDYATPEQGVPIIAPDGPWELSLTINDSWGYQHGDDNHKSVGQLVRYFTETIGAGGNLLLDVGPMADGTIPAAQVERLEGLGDWIRKHTEAVHGTGAGMPAGHHYGPSTLSADRRTLYVICFDVPRETVGVRGVKSPVRQVRVVGSGTVLGHRVIGGLEDAPGVLWIDAPSAADIDDRATVLAIELDQELELYRGTGRV